MAFWIPRKASLLCRNRHMMTHTGLKPWKCPTCGKGFQQKIHVEVILVSLLPWKVKSNNSTSCILKHQDDVQNYQIANNISFAFFLFQAHLSSVHSVTSQYMCSVCKREFTRPDALKRHLRIHTGN